MNQIVKPGSVAQSRAPRVLVLAYEQLALFEFSCVLEVFALPRPELAVNWYQFALTSIDAPVVNSALAGIKLEISYQPELLDQADLIVIPGWPVQRRQVPDLIVAKLSAALQRGARVATICSGVFLLAAAGLLHERVVTTHWRYFDNLQTLYPRLKINRHDLYVVDGQIISSAGSAAGLDMMLYLVRQDYGQRIANNVAQRLVLPSHRDGGQAQFLPKPVLSDRRHRLTHLLDYLQANLRQSHTLQSMAVLAAMSVRNLQRQFQLSLKISPLEYLLTIRIAHAKELLELGQLSLAQIAEQSGFASEASFRHHFRRFTATTPGLYRRQFAGRLVN